MRKLLLCLYFVSAVTIAADFPLIIDPVVNATPPGATVAAGYLTFVNESDKEIVITDAFSPTIAKVEIHLSSVENDVAKMEKQDNVTIEPGATLRFEHGGYHLMLMGLTAPLKNNDSIDVILTTSIGDMLIEMPVVKMGMTHGDAKKMGREDEPHADNHGKMKKNAEEDTKMDHQHDANKDGNDHTGSTKVVH